MKRKHEETLTPRQKYLNKMNENYLIKRYRDGFPPGWLKIKEDDNEFEQIMKYIMIFSWIPNELENDKEIIFEATKREPRLFICASCKLKDDRDFVLSLAKYIDKRSWCLRSNHADDIEIQWCGILKRYCPISRVKCDINFYF